MCLKRLMVGPSCLCLCPCLRHRFCKAIHLWERACMVIDWLNNFGDPTHFASAASPPACELPSRIDACQVDATVRDCWRHVLSRCKRVRDGCCRSQIETETSAALFSRLRKAMCDSYGHSSDDRPYRPFIAVQIKELAPDLPLLVLGRGSGRPWHVQQVWAPFPQPLSVYN